MKRLDSILQMSEIISEYRKNEHPCKDENKLKIINSIFDFVISLPIIYSEEINMLEESIVRFSDYYDRNTYHGNEILEYFEENYEGNDQEKLLEIFSLYVLLENIPDLIVACEFFDSYDELYDELNNNFYFDDVTSCIDFLNDRKVTYLEDISLYLTVEDLDKPVEFVVEKADDNSTKTYVVTPEKTKGEDGETKYVLGVVLRAEITKGFVPSIVYAFNEECAILKQMFVVLGSLFTGSVELNQLSGPVGIYSVVGEQSKAGIASLLYLTAFLSINVGVINLLPFPAFDGCHILFIIIEKLKGSPVKPEIQNKLSTIGLALLLLLMLVVTISDIIKLF